MTLPAWLPITISFFSLALAFTAFVWQIRRARFNQSVDLLFKLEADFFGPAKKSQRVKASTDLLEGKILEAEPILDFFETMALLLRRGALDKEIVWHTFFYWVDHYYEAAKDMIEQRQATDPLVWKDFVTFARTLRAYQVSQLKTAEYVSPTPNQVAEFLYEEQTEL